MKKILLTLIIVGGLGVGAPIVGSMLTQGQKQTADNDLGQQFDRFNLLIKKEPSYVKIDGKQSEKQEPGGYMYHQKVVSESGKAYDLSYYAGDKLKEAAYLKLDTKGRFVETWEEVQKEDIPKNVISKMETL